MDQWCWRNFKNLYALCWTCHDLHHLWYVIHDKIDCSISSTPPLSLLTCHAIGSSLWSCFKRASRRAILLKIFLGCNPLTLDIKKALPNSCCRKKASGHSMWVRKMIVKRTETTRYPISTLKATMENKLYIYKEKYPLKNSLQPKRDICLAVEKPRIKTRVSNWPQCTAILKCSC